MGKNIGILGENTSDVNSIGNLLQKKFEGLTYTEILKNITGSQLDGSKGKRAIKIELEHWEQKVVVFIRDADEVVTNKKKIDDRTSWYKHVVSGSKSKNVLLLNIYELEALIFADIKAFNDCFAVSIKGGSNVTYIHKPKEQLKQKTEKAKRKFHENDCPEIFSNMNINTVMNNCAYFKEFVDNLSKHISN